MKLVGSLEGEAAGSVEVGRESACGGVEVVAECALGEKAHREVVRCEDLVGRQIVVAGGGGGEMEKEEEEEGERGWRSRGHRRRRVE